MNSSAPTALLRSRLQLPEWWHFGLSFLGSCGLAFDATGRLYGGEGSESGYPFAVFVLPLHLASNIFLLLLGATAIRFTASQLFLLLCLVGYTVLLGANFVIGLIALGDSDYFNYLVHIVWVLAVVNGILVYLNAGSKAFLRGASCALTFLLTYNIVDVLLESVSCGPLLCGLGRTSSSFGAPGLYQEYVYLPTLICMLLAVRLQTRKVGPLTFLVAGVVIISTGSREGFLLFVCSVCLSAVYYKRRAFRKGWGLLGVAILAGVVALSTASLDIEDVALFEKFSAIESQFYGDNSRIDIVKSHLDLWMDSVIFGNYMRHPSSPNSVLVIDQPSAHNGYVDALATGGLMNLVLLLSLLVWLATMLWKGNERLKMEQHFPFFFVVFLLISMNINVPLRAPLLTYSLFGVVGILVCSWDWGHSRDKAAGRNTRPTFSATREVRATLPLVGTRSDLTST